MSIVFSTKELNYRCRQLHKPVIIALVDILPKNLRYPVDENEVALDDTLFHNLREEGYHCMFTAL